MSREDRPADEESVAAAATPAPAPAPAVSADENFVAVDPAEVPFETNVDVDQEAVLANFKAKYCVEGSIALDAWLYRGFIKYYISADSLMSLLDKQIPSEFEGLPTMVSLFPRHSDVGVVFSAAECDLVIAALNYAFINVDKFKAHLTEQGHPDTAKAADGLDALRIKVTDRQHEAQSNDDA